MTELPKPCLCYHLILQTVLLGLAHNNTSPAFLVPRHTLAVSRFPTASSTRPGKAAARQEPHTAKHVIILCNRQATDEGTLNSTRHIKQHSRRVRRRHCAATAAHSSAVTKHIQVVSSTGPALARKARRKTALERPSRALLSGRALLGKPRLAAWGLHGGRPPQPEQHCTAVLLHLLA